MTTRSTPPPGPSLVPTGFVKAMNSTTLRLLCGRAKATGFTRVPDDNFLDELDPVGAHITTISFYHRPALAFWEGRDHGFNFSHGGGVNVRARVVCKLLGREGPEVRLFDFDTEDFEALPDVPLGVLAEAGIA